MFLILAGGASTVVIGRWMFGKWFNHVSLYGGIWSASLALFELKLINYYPLEPETWIVIIGAWLAFVFGSLMVVLARFALGSPLAAPLTGLSMETTGLEQRSMRTILWVLNVVSLFAALQHWYIVVKKFGSVENVVVFGNLVYSLRVAGEFPGMLPYFDSLALSASFLAGVYTASRKKIELVAMLPLAIIVILEIANMARSKIVMAAVLFIAGLFLNPRRSAPRVSRSPSWGFRGATGIIVSIALLIAGLEFIRGTRGSIESIPAATRSLEKLRGSSFITPSIYMYVTIPHGVLNQYLKQDIEHTSIGSNMLAPVYRLLSKLGFDTPVRTYQKFYNTPAAANTGSYLRELHADFGLAGVLVLPFAFGAAVTAIWYRTRMKGSYTRVVILGHMYLIVAMSLFVIATRGGDLLVSFVGSIIAARVLDNKQSRDQT